MRKEWKSFILACVAILLMVFLSAATCSTDRIPSLPPTPARHYVVVNNLTRETFVNVYKNGTYYDRVSAHTRVSYPAFPRGTTLEIKNNVGAAMRFQGGSYVWTLTFDVEFTMTGGDILVSY